MPQCLKAIQVALVLPIMLLVALIQDTPNNADQVLLAKAKVLPVFVFVSQVISVYSPPATVCQTEALPVYLDSVRGP